ncbi:MAG: hypothetical protein M1812_005541 [Candelaria pacifica]|nr:MAG: hypothetical protein M1812_005541 [Candelaria pacifica]
MFRRLSSSLPKDPVWPHDLGELGYFVNEDDQIRSIKYPTQDFRYYINKNQRYNEMHGAAMNACIRNLVLERLHKAGLDAIRLPLGTGPEDPHVPILVSPDLHLRKRVVVIFNEHAQELGIWAYREIGTRSTINRGSAVDLVRYLQTPTNRHRRSDCPGIILANPGQLLWYRKGKRAISHAQRHVLPRKSAVHPPVTMASAKNLIPYNEDPEEHVEYIFREVIPHLCNPKAELNIIAVSDASDIVAKYIDKHWEDERRFHERITAMVFTEPTFTPEDIHNDDFAYFLTRRARGYILGAEGDPTGVLAPKLSFDRNLNIYSSEEKEYSECIMPAIWRVMIDFFQQVADNDEYSEPEIIEPPDEEDAVNGNGFSGIGDGIMWGGANGHGVNEAGFTWGGANGHGANGDDVDRAITDADGVNGDAVEIVLADAPNEHGVNEAGVNGHSANGDAAGIILGGRYARNGDGIHGTGEEEDPMVINSE